MAEQWYLINSNHDTVSGFESEDFDYYSRDAFCEALESSLGRNIEIYNYDLSLKSSARMIPLDAVADTKLKTVTRQILMPIGTCHAGQYVYYEDKYWLIAGFVDNNALYEKAIIYLCNYLLTWINQQGKIVQRWVYVTSASQYNNGETEDRKSVFILRSDQLMVWTPDDKDCLLMPHNQRVIIDRRCDIYEEDFKNDLKIGTKLNLMVYKLTRLDNTLYSYQGSGHSEFMATQDEQNENDGYVEIDGCGYWLCDIDPADVVTPPSPPSTQYCEILYDEAAVYSGLEPTEFTAKFYDSDGKENYTIPQWEIDCDFADKLKVDYSNTAIIISINDAKQINKSFELSLFADGYDRQTITVKIKEFI